MDKWERCYNLSWSGLIVPESFSHPAKFSRGLINRIYEHALEMRWVERGDWVLDPFGGVALGAVNALCFGLNWVGVELEEKFVKLGQQNIDRWVKRFRGWDGLGTARIVQGDSRRIGKILEEVDLVISSSPYAHNRFDGGEESLKQRQGYSRGYSARGGYAENSPGNLANLKEGSIDAVISSPPYEETLSNPSKKVEFTGVGGPIHPLNYSHSPSNLGNTSGDTFWAASREIVQGCYDLLRSGGEPVPDGEGIDFCEGHNE